MHLTVSQVASFIEKGISSAYITGGQHDKDILCGVINGKFKIVYFTPKMLLLNKNWRELLTTNVYVENLRALVVDEAHTVKKW